MSNLVPVSWRDSVGQVRERVSGLFDRWLSTHRPQPQASQAWPAIDRPFALEGPTVDIEETDDEIEVTAEVPGIEPKDLDVKLEDSRLVLQGEKRASREEKRRSYYYAENAYGSFYRAIPLPCEVDADAVRATCKHGVLKVRMPKTEEAKAKAVRVPIR